MYIIIILRRNCFVNFLCFSCSLFAWQWVSFNLKVQTPSLFKLSISWKRAMVVFWRLLRQFLLKNSRWLSLNTHSFSRLGTRKITHTVYWSCAWKEPKRCIAMETPRWFARVYLMLSQWRMISYWMEFCCIRLGDRLLGLGLYKKLDGTNERMDGWKQEKERGDTEVMLVVVVVVLVVVVVVELVW